jgi:hypothetical protein
VNTHENDNWPKRLYISDDGYIRLSKITLESIHFRHLDSGLYDDEVVNLGDFDMACSILGYTEWVTDTEPAISIGWDWTVEYFTNPPRIKMVGLPFSNIILQDHNDKDMNDEICMHYLIVLISQINWMEQLHSVITKKYS